jgi:superfamily II DNA or RNA helicase
MLAENYEGRKTVGFVPLISTSKDLAAACRGLGLRAVHVDGDDRSAMDCFSAGRADIVLNPSLLTTGWDFPALSCVAMMRPTESFNLFSQMVGRGTRLSPGKDHLLVLDPLWQADDMGLIRPSSLVTSAPIERTDTFDLLDAGEEAEKEAEERKEADRLAKLKEAMDKNAKRVAREVDPIDFADGAGLPDFANYSPATDYEGQPATPKQIETLTRNGFPSDGWTLGRAIRMIDLLSERMRQGLASAKQVRFLRRQGVPDAFIKTFDEASAFISSKIAG